MSMPSGTLQNHSVLSGQDWGLTGMRREDQKSSSGAGGRDSDTQAGIQPGLGTPPPEFQPLLLVLVPALLGCVYVCVCVWGQPLGTVPPASLGL